MRFSADKWLVTPEPRPGAVMRLICFHHAGGGALSYRSWTPHLRNDVELVAVQLPGRENRFGETPLEGVDRIFEGLAPALREATRLPYAMFGHSLGARLALHVAQQMQALRAPPVGLFVSGARPPANPGSLRPATVERPTDRELLDTLARLGGTPAALFEDEAWLSAFLPALRADMALNRHLCEQPSLKLDCPIVALGGHDDKGAPRQRLAEWQAFSNEPVTIRMFPGGHFFTQSSMRDVVEVINASLAEHLRRRSSASPAYSAAP